MKLFYRFLAHLSKLEYRSYYLGDRTSQAIITAYYVLSLSLGLGVTFILINVL